MKKLLVIALVTLVAFTSVFANGSNESEEVKITLCSADNTYGLATDPDLQNAVNDLIKEKTGVTVTPIVPPLSTYTDKLATLVNSGDIPDVFTVAQAMVNIPKMAAREQLYDLTDYIANSEKLSVISKNILSFPYTNGRYYFVPYNNPKSKAIMLRKDVMEEYGINLSHTPTTEEFVTEMSKLKGTGIVPFTFPKWVDNFQYFYNTFGAWGGVYLNEDGKYVDGFQEEKMKDALTFIHSLYENGILNAEFITTENAQMREAVYTKKSAADIDYVTNYINYIQNTATAGVPTEMFLIYDIIGPNGEGGSLNEATQTAFCVSAKTKNPDEAFKVIEALVTDPELYPAFFALGVEGQHYTIDENKNIVPSAKAANSGYKYTLNYLSDSFINIDIDTLDFKLSDAMMAGIEDQRAYIKEAANYLGPNHSSDVPTGISDEYDRVNPSIKSTRESIAAKIVMGSVTVEEGMKEYQNFWKSINGEKLLADLNASL